MKTKFLIINILDISVLLHLFYVGISNLHIEKINMKHARSTVIQTNYDEHFYHEELKLLAYDR